MERRESRAVLSAHPDGVPVASSVMPGTHHLAVKARGDSVLCVPSRPATGRPVPLLVTPHGAGGLPQGSLVVLQTVADRYGSAVLVPVSRSSTWDGIRTDYGPDVDVINRSLHRAFNAVAVDPGRISIAGFSDGASYALGRGLANGDLFGLIIAFSPGFIPPLPVGETSASWSPTG
jgi:poly(3-hydroxybutyrate) depolymerase